MLMKKMAHPSGKKIWVGPLGCPPPIQTGTFLLCTARRKRTDLNHFRYRNGSDPGNALTRRRTSKHLLSTHTYHCLQYAASASATSNCARACHHDLPIMKLMCESICRLGTCCVVSAERKWCKWNLKSSVPMLNNGRCMQMYVISSLQNASSRSQGWQRMSIHPSHHLPCRCTKLTSSADLGK
jgi:hypothetical protein